MASRALVLIIGYAGALAWGAYAWQRSPQPPEPPERVANGSIDLPSVLPSALGDIEAFDEILERPLFTADRRPIPVAAASIETTSDSSIEPPADLASVRLTAIFADGSRMTALVENPSGRIDKVQRGGRLYNWRVDQVAEDRILLSAGGREHTLLVHRFDASPMLAPQARPTVGGRRPPRVVPVLVEPDETMNQATQDTPQTSGEDDAQ